MPALTCFCFEENRVYAYDDACATVVTLEHNLNCGIRGEVLLSLCQSSPGKFDIVQEGESCILVDTESNSTFKLPFIGPEQFVFDWPVELQSIRFKVGREFFEMLEVVVNNLLADSYQPQLAGVTLEIYRNKVIAYGYDFASLIRFDLEIDSFWTTLSDDEPVRTIIMSKPAAERARKVFSAMDNPDLRVECKISSGWIWFDFEDKKVMSVSKLVVAEPASFSEDLEGFPLQTKKFAVPPGMKNALDRCLILMGEHINSPITMYTGEEGIKIVCNAPHGHADMILGGPALPTMKLRFRPKILHRHIGACKKMGFTTDKKARAVQFFNDTMTYVVGTVVTDQQRG